MDYFHRLVLRERTLGLTVMVAFVLEMIWRQISGVCELVRIVQTESVLWATPRKVSQQAGIGSLDNLAIRVVFESTDGDIADHANSVGGTETAVASRTGLGTGALTETQAVDGSTLDALIRKTGLLKDCPQNP